MVRVARREVGGGDAEAAERRGEADQPLAEIGEHAERSRDLAGDRVDRERRGGRGPQLGQRERRGARGVGVRRIDRMRHAVLGELERLAVHQLEHRRRAAARVEQQDHAVGAGALRELAHRGDRDRVAGERGVGIGHAGDACSGGARARPEPRRGEGQHSRARTDVERAPALPGAGATQSVRWLACAPPRVAAAHGLDLRGSDRAAHGVALAVFKALRSFLPELAALAGNAPLHAGRDTGLASVRPKLAEMLPCQSLPPAFPSWRALAEFTAWVEPGLVAWLGERHDAGEALAVHESARIAENRWRALRHGLDGELLDLDSGALVPTRARVQRLIETVAPAAERLGGRDALDHARALAEHNGAERQRALAAEGGMRGVVEWLADAFAP